MIVPTISAPWEATLSEAQHSLILYFLGFACLALFAGLLRTVVTKDEVGARFRGATVARVSVMGIATVSYVFMVVMFFMGYDSTPAGWVPNEYAISFLATRYIDWSITVPLLVAELMAVTTLVGPAARRTQGLAMATAFLMIFTGFLGSIVIGGGESETAMVVLGLISCVSWIATNVLLIGAVRASIPGLTAEAGLLLRSATIVLLGGWVAYPLIAVIQLVAFGGEWTTTMQIAICVADVVVKVGFAGLIHRVAKLRTAEDVRAGRDVHPEAIWISSVKQSDAGSARQVFLDESSTIHPSRTQRPGSEAVAAASTGREYQEQSPADM